MNYEGTSDFHLSMEVAKVIGLKICEGQYYEPCVSYWDSKGHCVMFDINNPADILPIAFENDIDLISPTTNGTEYWEAHKFFTDVKVSPLNFLDKNPLRALAVIILKNKEKHNAR